METSNTPSEASSGTNSDTSTSSVDTSVPVSTSTGKPSSTLNETPASTPTPTGQDLTPGEKATAEAKKYKFKLNIKGQEEDAEYDEQSLIKELQKSRAASKIREEAARDRDLARQETAQIAQEREQFKQVIEALKNPQTARQLLRQIGTPLEDLSRAELEEFVQLQQMSPEQRELHELRNWKQQQQQQVEQQRQQQAHKEYEAQVQAAQEQFSSRIVGAMQKLGLTETDARASGEIAQRLAFKLEQSLNAGWDMTPDELAEELMQDMQEQHRALYGKLPGEKIFKLWGEEGLKKAQEFATQRVPHVPSLDNPQRPQGSQSTQEPASTIPKFKTRKEWLDYVDSIPAQVEEE